MASIKRMGQDPKSYSDIIATVGFFINLCGIGLDVVLETLPVKDLIGNLWLTVLLILGVGLALVGGVGGIYWLVAWLVAARQIQNEEEKLTQVQNEEGKLTLVALIRGTLEGGMSPGERRQRTG